MGKGTSSCRGSEFPMMILVVMLISSLAAETKKRDSDVMVALMRVFDACRTAGANLSVW